MSDDQAGKNKSYDDFTGSKFYNLKSQNFGSQDTPYQVKGVKKQTDGIRLQNIDNKYYNQKYYDLENDNKSLDQVLKDEYRKILEDQMLDEHQRKMK